MADFRTKLSKTNILFSPGVALVEVIAALGIAVVVITSLTSLSLYAMRSTLETKMLQQGTKVATKEVELVRAFRDSMGVDWESFINSVKSCTGNTDTGQCSIDSSDPNNLSVKDVPIEVGTEAETVTMYFTATRPGGGGLQTGDSVARIDAAATWTIGGNIKSTHIITDLTNWRYSQ